MLVSGLFIGCYLHMRLHVVRTLSLYRDCMSLASQAKATHMRHMLGKGMHLPHCVVYYSCNGEQCEGLRKHTRSSG